MKKNNSTQTNQGLLTLTGRAYFDELNGCVLFSPDDITPGIAQRFRGPGTGTTMPDGTFEFVPKPPRARYESELLAKVPHGRLSRSKDGTINFTLRFAPDENISINEAIMNEAWMAANQ